VSARRVTCSAVSRAASRERPRGFDDHIARACALGEQPAERGWGGAHGVQRSIQTTSRPGDRKVEQLHRGPGRHRQGGAARPVRSSAKTVVSRACPTSEIRAIADDHRSTVDPDGRDRSFEA
jgi:hypothetical protein